MNYDFTFFVSHSERSRYYTDNEAPSTIGGALVDLYETENEAKKHYEILMRATDPYDFASASLVRCNGAYSRGNTAVEPLKKRLGVELPEDFAQFYEQFGESVMFTRNMPLWIRSLDWMIESFEDCLDVNVSEAYFFPFAYIDESSRLGLLRSDSGDKWQVIPFFGDLYSEITMKIGKSNNPTFYEWLKHLVETDGAADGLFPEGPNLTVTNDAPAGPFGPVSKP